jgi:hypothetical protein
LIHRSEYSLQNDGFAGDQVRVPHISLFNSPKGGKGNAKNSSSLSLSRMTALELKSYKEKETPLTKEKNKNINSNNSQQKVKKKKDSLHRQNSELPSPSLSHSNSQAYATLSVGLVSDLESLSNRMNNVLNRASRAVNDDNESGLEDENDFKMKQLLEEIYSIDLNPTNAINEITRDNENENLESDERRFGEDLSAEETEEMSDERKFEEYLKKWSSSSDTKGIF